VEAGMTIRVVGIGEVTLPELEAMFAAYLNAGAPRPALEGTPEEQKTILTTVASRGDLQLRSFIDHYIQRLSDA